MEQSIVTEAEVVRLVVEILAIIGAAAGAVWRTKVWVSKHIASKEDVNAVLEETQRINGNVRRNRDHLTHVEGFLQGSQGYEPLLKEQDE